MFAPEFLAMLICPTTRQQLRAASEAELQAANDAIASGGVCNRGGRSVDRPVSAALVTADGAWLYPVLDGIPILLESEGIPADTTETR